MKHIHKYTLPMGGWCAIQLPACSRLLSAEEQHGAVALYAEVDRTKAADGQLRMHMIMTGDLAPEGAEFLNTIMMAGGTYVVHVYAEWVRHG
ncbi:MAG TPA: hypothetical protein VF797_21630 [Noviherbaspirillum sp.]